MSRVEEIWQHLTDYPHGATSAQLVLIQNIQDINETLAKMYDLEEKAMANNEKPPEWLERWQEEWMKKVGMK